MGMGPHASGTCLWQNGVARILVGWASSGAQWGGRSASRWDGRASGGRPGHWWDGWPLAERHPGGTDGHWLVAKASAWEACCQAAMAHLSSDGRPVGPIILRLRSVGSVASLVGSVGSMSFPNWQLQDLFSMDPPAVRALKIRLASHLGVRYAQCNQHKPFATDASGVTAYQTKDIFSQWKQHTDDQTSGKKSTSATTCTIVNACQVKWECASATNVSYICNACLKYVENWDTSVERRAAGLADDKWEPQDEQELVLTNMSSLLALVAMVVYHYQRHGQVPPELANAFCSVRVSLYFLATPDEIRALNSVENVEQMQRKAHTELDNVNCVRQWRASMQSYPGLNADSALDVVKYAMVINDLRSTTTPSWLLQLLNGRAPTMVNKLAAMKPLTVKQVRDLKGAPSHPQMSSYAAISMRFRFLKGFSEEALRSLHELLFERMAQEGLASRPFPLATTTLMSPDILCSSAFSTNAERERVPAWRDGAMGAALQRRMPGVAAARFFEHGGLNSNRPLFNSGASWVAFTRLIDHVQAVFVAEFGEKGTWEDSPAIRMREIMKGEYDHEFVQFASVAGAHLDTAPHMMAARIKAELPCVSRLLKSYEEARAVGSVGSVGSMGSAPSASSEAEKPESAASVEAVKQESADGVVSDSVSGFSDMSIAEKRAIVADLNKRAEEERAAQLRRILALQASAILRNRLKIVKRAEQARACLFPASSRFRISPAWCALVVSSGSVGSSPLACTCCVHLSCPGRSRPTWSRTTKA